MTWLETFAQEKGFDKEPSLKGALEIIQSKATNGQMADIRHHASFLDFLNRNDQIADFLRNTAHKLQQQEWYYKNETNTRTTNRRTRNTARNHKRDLEQRLNRRRDRDYEPNQRNENQIKGLDN